jgi:hypothetical protein
MGFKDLGMIFCNIFKAGKKSLDFLEDTFLMYNRFFGSLEICSMLQEIILRYFTEISKESFFFQRTLPPFLPSQRT